VPLQRGPPHQGPLRATVYLARRAPLSGTFRAPRFIARSAPFPGHLHPAPAPHQAVRHEQRLGHVEAARALLGRVAHLPIDRSAPRHTGRCLHSRMQSA